MSVSAPAPADTEAAPPSLMSKIKGLLWGLWNPPKEKLVVRFMLSLASFALVLSVGFSYVLVKKIRHDFAPQTAENEIENEEEDHAEAEVAGGEHAAPEGHGGQSAEVATLGGSPFPKSILRRQDGIPEEGYDLTEPQIENARGLASLVKEDLKVSLGDRFIDVPGILANPRFGSRTEGSVQVDLSLEVPSLELQAEVEARKVEIKALVGNIGGNFQRKYLRSTEGMLAFKQEIQRELNLLLVKGKVSDVLFVNYKVN